jgi:hypothetical protein
MTTEFIISIAIPILLNLITFAVLFGRMKQKQDDQNSAIKGAHMDSEHVQTRLIAVERQTAVITTELVGISGNNGLKSEVRKLNEKMDRLMDHLLNHKE